jgi:hypothetical protein
MASGLSRRRYMKWHRSPREFGCRVERRLSKWIGCSIRSRGARQVVNHVVVVVVVVVVDEEQES